MLISARVLVDFVVRVYRRVRDVDVDRVAGNLSFTTLLGLVPLFTVAFTYVARLPLFNMWLDALEPTLIRFLLPGGSGQVRGYLAEFTARTAEIKGVSIAFVVYTAVMLVAQVEREINAVWGILTRRSFVRRVVVYALGFIAVPALIGGAIVSTKWALERSAEAVPIANDALSFLSQLIGLSIGTLVLTLLYLLVPARRVPWRAALVAGMLAAIAFEFAKMAFAFYIARVPTYQIVYGALAALPLFLVWVYLSWMILLVGAAISATLAEIGGNKLHES